MGKKSGRKLVLACLLGIAALAAIDVAAAAEQCRDTNGRFMKCPTTTATNRCRDITSKKFVKCGTAHSEPVPHTAAK
jgi:hypothetical protein